MKSYVFLFWCSYLAAIGIQFHFYEKPLNSVSNFFCISFLIVGILLRKLLWGSEFLKEEQNSFSEKKNHRFFLYFGKVFPSNQSHREEMQKLLKVSDKKQMFYVGISLIFGIASFIYIVQKSSEITFNQHMFFCLGNFVLLLCMAYLNHLRLLIFVGCAYSLLLFFKNPYGDMNAFIGSLFVYSFSILLVDKIESKESLRRSVIQAKMKQAMVFSLLLACGLFLISEKQEDLKKDKLSKVEQRKMSETVASWVVDQLYKASQDSLESLKQVEEINFDQTQIPMEKLAKLKESFQFSELQIKQLKLKNLEIGGRGKSSTKPSKGQRLNGNSNSHNFQTAKNMGLNSQQIQILMDENNAATEAERDLIRGSLSPEDYIEQVATRAEQAENLDELYSSYRKNLESIIEVNEADIQNETSKRAPQLGERNESQEALAQLNEKEKSFLKTELERQKKDLEKQLLVQSKEDEGQTRWLNDRIKSELKSSKEASESSSSLEMELKSLQNKIKDVEHLDDEKMAAYLTKNSIGEEQGKRTSVQKKSNPNAINEIKENRSERNFAKETSSSTPKIHKSKTKLSTKKELKIDSQKKAEEIEKISRWIDFLFKGLKLLSLGLAGLFVGVLVYKFTRKDLAEDKLRSRDVERLKRKLANSLKTQNPKKLAFEEEVLKTYHDFLLMFEILDFAKPKDQVPTDFQKRVREHFPDLHNDFTQITDHFCDAYYGKQSFSDQQKENFYNSKKNLQKKFLGLH